MLGTRRRTFRHDGLLGTFVEIVVRSNRAIGRAVERFVVEEIARWQRRFSAFEPESELSCWTGGRLSDGDTSDEFRELLALAESWHHRTAGIFNPLVGRAAACWGKAERSGKLPTDAELQAIAADIDRCPFTVDVDDRGRRSVIQTGRLDGFQLNALAKGWIVDTVFEAARGRFDVDDLLISAGGDVRLAGRSPFRVAIEDPASAHRRASLAAPSLDTGALATSGGAHRFVRVDGRRYSHLIDPRTARPVDHVSSASVVATDLTTADVIATVLTVLDPTDGIEFADRHGVGCLIAARGHDPLTNSAWPGSWRTGS